MPLTQVGRKALTEFKREYKLRGEDVFYAYMKKYPKKTESWHKKKRQVYRKTRKK